MKRKTFSAILAMVMLAFVIFNVAEPSIATESSLHEEAAINFLAAQYGMQGIQYETLTIIDTIDLMDAEDKDVLAEMIVVSRDGTTDYVVLNNVTGCIDEFGFDQADYIGLFQNKSKVLYAGLLNYAYYDGDDLKSLTSEEKISEDVFLQEIQMLKEIETTKGNDGFGGFMSWASLNQNMNNLPNSSGYGGRIVNSDWSYLRGITPYGVSSGLYFYDQNVLNNAYNKKYGKNITGTCGPTAITNMFIYYKYRGFTKALINGSVNDTFERILLAVDWTNGLPGGWWDKTIAGMKRMAKEVGYGYTIKAYGNVEWANFKECLKTNDMPMYTYLYHHASDFVHAVVSVGYEEFTHNYTTTEYYWFFGWKPKVVEHSDVYKYLRVIDGWNTSNSSRFIDYNSYYNKVMAIGFKLK